MGTVIRRTGAGCRADDPPRRENNFQRPKRSLVDRQQQRRGDAFKNHLGSGASRGGAGIIEARHLRADAAQVDGHLIAAHLDADLDRNMFAEIDAVVSM
jgi:hypothetical protein